MNFGSSKIEAGKLDFELNDFILRYTMGDIMAHSAASAAAKARARLAIAAQCSDALVGRSRSPAPVIVTWWAMRSSLPSRGSGGARRAQGRRPDEVDCIFAHRHRHREFRWKNRRASRSVRASGPDRLHGAMVGSGLGLAIPHGSPNDGGAKFWVESRAGRGSEFSFHPVASSVGKGGRRSNRPSR